MRRSTRIALIFLTCASAILYASDEPKLYVEHSFISFDYLRESVPFLDFVRDGRQSDIHLMVTRRAAGNGGREYTLSFTGQNRFAGLTDTLTLFTTSFDTDETVREAFVKTLYRGLMTFLTRTELIRDFDIVYVGQDSVSVPSDDPWNFWVSRIRLSGDISGEKSRTSHDFYGSLRVDRITADWKIHLTTEMNYEEDTYDYAGDRSTSIDRRQAFYSTVVKSVNDHISMGMFSEISSSTYQNITRLYKAQLAVEYNVYPYALSTYKSLTFRYSLGMNRYTYREITIYDRKSEYLGEHRLEMEVEFTQKWGGIDMRIRYGSHLGNLSRNRIEARGWVSLNLAEGFSLDFGGGYSRINDQISIPRQDVSIEDILLGRKELATEFDYWASMGISFTFGSIFNNVVNPRF